MAREFLKILQLCLPKVSIGWAFALLTVNFNRITIHELAVPAVLITTMIGLYHFLSPFQVFFGRVSDRVALFGFRRVPYLAIGTVLAASIFPLLPIIAVEMSKGNTWAFVAGYVLLILFGIGHAMSGNAHYALVAEAISEKRRGIAISLLWITMIATVIFSASVMKKMMPDYSHEAMQSLYNLSPFIAVGSILPLFFGVEQKLTHTELCDAHEQTRIALPQGNIFAVAKELLERNQTTRLFFFFILFSTIGIFLQDTILEVFGAEVLKMSVRETSSFQQIWGSGVLLAMLVMGIATARWNINRLKIALLGNYGTAIGLLLLALTAALESRTLLYPVLLVMGVSTGLHTLGAVTTMMDLTVDGARATYMGLWGLAMSIGSGLSGVLAGALVTMLIETAFLSSSNGYALIFSLEAGLMLIGALVLRGADFRSFKPIRREELTVAMAND